MNQSPLIPPDPSVPPHWVEVWKEARRLGDLRVFPEQEAQYRSEGLPWPPPEGIMPAARRAQLEARLS